MHMPSRLVLSLILLASPPLASAAEPAPAARTEVPIRQVVLSNGERRYAVQIGLGDAQIDAGLDSGSTGLRVVAPPPSGVRPSTHRTSYSYTSGTRLDGVMADAELSIGAVGGSSPIQLVTATACTDQKPNCPAKRIPFSQYGIQGDGLPGEGFKAILGVSMGSAEVPNPLIRLGVRRWIIELPRPGEQAPGRLILNPTDQEAQGFQLFHLTDRAGARTSIHDALDGCLVNRQTKRSICGIAILDTGAPGIRVVTAERQPVWPNGTPGSMAFFEHGKAQTALDFTVGLRAQASRFTTEAHDGVPTPRLFLGLTPYFAYSVLYDPAAGVIGLKSRPAAG